MSIEADRNKLASLEKARAQINKSLVNESDRVFKKKAEINSIKRTISKNTPLSQLNSKEKQIESKQKQLLSYEKKEADLRSKLSAKDSEILKLISKIEKAEEQAKKKKGDEEKKRMAATLKHQKDISKELEKQSRVHKDLSRSPIVIEYSKLPEEITVLFVGSNPNDQSWLRLDDEIRLITKKIREAEYRNSVKLKSIWATRPNDLLQALNEHKPTIVHFSGHGSSENELIMQGEQGETKLVSLKTIAATFELAAEGVKLVVFNTCFSENQAYEVVEHIPATIGMSSSISDEAARVFSAQLYSAISFGKNIGDSFNQAKVALMLEDISEEETPQLFIQEDLSSENIILVKP